MRAYHTLVTGDSGGGKTTLLREMHDRFTGLSIWVNHNQERNVPGAYASGRQAMQSADRATINLRVSDVNEGAKLAREFGRDYWEQTGYPFQVIVDEAQDEALPDGSTTPDTPVKRGLHQDRDHGGKWVVASQDPSDLHYTPLKQCQWYCWVGPWATFHEGFIRYFNIDKSTLPTADYQYVVLDKQMSPVYQGETDPTYG